MTQVQPNDPVSFGNFGSQVCGSLQLGLVQAQSAMAKTGAELTQSLTEEQIGSYKGQSTFMNDGFQEALNSAASQRQQMMFQAATEWVGAGISIASAIGTYHATNFSDPAKKLTNTTNKLAQQEKLLSLAKEPSSLPSMQAGEEAEMQNLQPEPNSKEAVAEARKQKLIEEGGLQARTLKEIHEKAEEHFPQESFNPDKGHYYNENPSQKELSNGHATSGSYYAKDLDEAAVKRMTPAEKREFVSKLEKQIANTRTEENNVRMQVQMRQQMIDQTIAPLANNINRGSWQIPQANCGADAKRQDAAATIANQDSNVAGSVVNGFRTALDSAQKSAESGMQAFGRVFDGMRA